MHHLPHRLLLRPRSGSPVLHRDPEKLAKPPATLAFLRLDISFAEWSPAPHPHRRASSVRPWRPPRPPKSPQLSARFHSVAQPRETEFVTVRCVPFAALAAPVA